MAQSEVVPDFQELKPGSGQEHICIIFLYDVDVANVRQHSYEALLYQTEVVLSTFEAKFRNCTQ